MSNKRKPPKPNKTRPVKLLRGTKGKLQKTDFSREILGA